MQLGEEFVHRRHHLLRDHVRCRRNGEGSRCATEVGIGNGSFIGSRVGGVGVVAVVGVGVGVGVLQVDPEVTWSHLGKSRSLSPLDPAGGTREKVNK